MSLGLVAGARSSRPAPRPAVLKCIFSLALLRSALRSALRSCDFCISLAAQAAEQPGPRIHPGVLSQSRTLADPRRHSSSRGLASSPWTGWLALEIVNASSSRLSLHADTSAPCSAGPSCRHSSKVGISAPAGQPSAPFVSLTYSYCSDADASRELASARLVFRPWSWLVPSRQLFCSAPMARRLRCMVDLVFLQQG